MADNGKTTRYLIQRKIDAREVYWQDVTWVTVPSRAKRPQVLQAAADALEQGVPVTLRALDEASAQEHSGTPQLRFV